ncbi:DUF4265 domain-containing protein [Kitasatospora sp. NPDC093558]|uniref:DUF4265 domain-containing protein n=1 Tax=Kitasatospora sp. NPDC093558 TaxID=3155201 RepID=UPI00343A51BD
MVPVTNSEENHVKVHFPLDVDEDGWPPVGVESVRAVDLGDGTVRVANAPWFAQGIASGDVVRVELDEDGVRWAEETVEASDHCTIRLIVLQDGGSTEARQAVLDDFHRLGTTGEGIERFGMVALDVPPSADLPRIRALLERGDAEGRWDWEEGCVTAAWTAAGA